MKYLYSFAVQGIQNYIFQTNELKDIVGASELVGYICTDCFEEFYDEYGKDGLIIGAAGNIKYEFENEDKCRKAVREFPKKVMQKAPGVIVSQAVVKYDSDDIFKEAIDELERRLKTQRNKQSKSLSLGLIGITRSRTTGLPAVHIEKDDYIDESIKAKRNFKEKKELGLCSKSFYGKKNNESLNIENIAINIDKMTGKNDWIAVIHADGNGLGKVVQNVGKREDDFRTFSQNLDKATTYAANDAYNAVKDMFKGKTPIRPIVLGGDDMTVIIRGDLAIPYVTEFLKKFEEYTHDLLGCLIKKYDVFNDGADKLTACAGVAFIKSSYPFYYGYNLAEDLCGIAKKDAKRYAGEDCLAPSCLMFHKVQDSFVESYGNIAKRELITSSRISFRVGPYYISESNIPEGRITIDQLKEYSDNLNDREGNSIKSGIRQWITLMFNNKPMAEQKVRRMKSLYNHDYTKTQLIEKLTETLKSKEEDTNINGLCMAYDVLAYNTIMTQKTKEDEEDGNKI